MDVIDLGTGKMLAHVEDGVGWMTFNNPERLNAMSLEMWGAVEAIVERFAGDDGVRVVVMKGAGEKAFVSGADISQFEEKRADARAEEEYAKVSGAARGRMAGFEKPLIAMIRGYCLGGGLGIALLADLRIASDDARFGIPAARLGLAYGPDPVKRLLDLVGPAHTKEILFTGRRLAAAEALRIGLVNRVVPVDELEAEVEGLAATLVDNAPLSIRAAKAVVDEMGKDAADRDGARMERVARACFDSKDYVEGRHAFMEKRKPVFRGE